MKPLIVIDAGHGGTDPGAVGHDGTREATLALRVARELAIELTRCGHRAVLTRTDDTLVALGERADIANAEKADAFVSIHMNASNNTTARGAWVIHAQGSTRGRALATAIFRAMVPEGPEKVHPDASPFTGERRLAVLRKTNMPAALVECGFISSPAELAAMKAPTWPTETAVKIAQGIRAWIDSEDEEGAA